MTCNPHINSFLLAFASVFVPIASSADSWPAATPLATVSPTGTTVVRITPGENLGDTFGFAGAETGQFAKATYHRLDQDGEYLRVQEADLINPIAPVFAALTEAGTLVTLDNWHNMGIGQVIAIYEPDGTHRESFALDHFYSKEQLARMQMSTSSLWWRCGEPYIDHSFANLIIHDQIGGILTLNLRDSSFTYQKHGSHCAAVPADDN